MNNDSNQPTPAAIMQIGMGFWASKVLLTAVNFGLFTRLAEQSSMSAEEVKSALGLNCSDRNLFDFLDCLTGLGFLKREGLLETGRYSNASDTNTFLDKNKPSYIGGILEMQNNRGWKVLGNLDEGLKTGLIQSEAKDGGATLFDSLYQDPQALKEFAAAMTGIQMGNFTAFAQNFDFSKYKTLLDVGGSAGVLSALVAKHQPHMSCTSFDLPQLEPIANETIQKFGLTDRVKTFNGDFFNDELPKANIVTMGNILHDWDEETKIKLMQKAYDALPAGGVFIAIENIIDDDRKENVFGLMMSLNMLVETGDGFDYTFDDFSKWAKQVGFTSTSILPLAGPSSAAIAYK